MRVAVTGARGQLGSELVSAFLGSGATVEPAGPGAPAASGARAGHRGHEVIALGRDELDITDYDRAMQVLVPASPDVIVHAAAYTDVDGAESDSVAAFRVNALGTRNVAAAAAEVGACLCHISTDYVFDGERESYREWDAPNPINVYGESKLAAESEVRDSGTRWVIIRTSWVSGLTGGNFVKTMLRLAGEQDRIRVVDDQTGCPTFAADLAAKVSDLCIRRRTGLFHITNGEPTTWFGLARAVFEAAGLDPDRIEPAATEEMARPAPRPRSSVLENFVLAHSGLGTLRGWREPLGELVAQLASGVDES